MGGPVVIPKLYNGHDKTFFFFAGEPRYQSDKQQQLATVPTDGMRTGDFSNLVLLGYVAILVKVQAGTAWLRGTPDHAVPGICIDPGSGRFLRHQTRDQKRHCR